MKKLILFALFALTLPAAAQTDSRPLPPGSFQYDRLHPPGMRDLPDTRDFQPPSPVTLMPAGPTSPLPPGSYQHDALPRFSPPSPVTPAPEEKAKPD